MTNKSYEPGPFAMAGMFGFVALARAIPVVIDGKATVTGYVLPVLGFIFGAFLIDYILWYTCLRTRDTGQESVNTPPNGGHDAQDDARRPAAPG